MALRLRLVLVATLLFSVALLAAPIKKSDPDNPLVVIKTNFGDIVVELFPKQAPKTVANFLDLAFGKKTFTNPNTGKKEKRPFYNGLIFHRVMKKFMIQGGCPKGTGRSGPGYQFADEINAQSLGLHKIKAMKNGKPHRWLLIRTQDEFQRAIVNPLLAKMGIKTNEELNKRRAEVDKALAALTLADVYTMMGYQYSTTLKSSKPVRGSLAMANAGPNTNGSQFFINVIDTPWLTGKHTVFGHVRKGMDVVDKISNTDVGAGSKPVTDVKIISITLYKQ